MRKILLGLVGILVFVLAVFLIEKAAQTEKSVSLVTAEAAKTAAPKFQYGLEDGIKFLLGKAAKEVNIKQVTWAGHKFERGILSTGQYKTDGNKDVKFTNSGFSAPSYSLPRSKLLDVDLNQKIKINVLGTFEGGMESPNEGCTGGCITTERYHFSEFGIYIIDESGNRQGMRVLGTRENIVRGNSRSKYLFTELTIENTGSEIVVSDSSGFKLAYSPDFKYVTSGNSTEENNGTGNYNKLDIKKKWFLGINCHVNGVGYCKLDIKEIQTVKNIDKKLN